MNRQLSERFEVAFNEIHDWLKTQNRPYKNDAFSVLLSETKNKSAVVRQYFYDLKEFAELRNALVHERRLDKYIAEPHEEIVLEIEHIRRDLLQPKNALSISSRPVETLDLNVSIQEALKKMQQHDFSQFPIYEENEFKGFVTEKGILLWVTSHLDEDGLIFSDYELADVLAFEPAENVLFLAESANVYEVKELFEQDLQTGKRKLDAVIVTKNGRKNEKPLGIITSWDLIKIE